MINKNFISILKGLNTPEKMEAVKLIMSRFNEGLATDSKFYDKRDKVQRVINTLFEDLNTTDKFIEAIIRIEANSPYSIFGYILKEDFSDLVFHSKGYNASNNGVEEKNILDKSIWEVYNIFLDHFINNIKFISNSKFDPSNAIIDTEIGIYRFNLIHNSLQGDGKPLIVIRKDTINKSFNMDENYLNGISDSRDQKSYIQKYSKEGNVIVFGSTGSGKSLIESQKLVVYRKKK